MRLCRPSRTTRRVAAAGVLAGSLLLTGRLRFGGLGGGESADGTRRRDLQ